MARERKKAGLNFEASLKKLEGIVRRLEDEQVSLEDSIRLFSEGKNLAKVCESELQEAENRVRQLMEDAEGNLTETALESGGAGEKAGSAKAQSGAGDKPSDSGGGPDSDNLPF
ncbi:exodeoxyribonuclease VII small subunit [Candidatus Sumerlaeota bacterium]|nr:exodeoxyribonuclease VII small subunit [Candidatus Sumerlaeota bacterium]